MPAEEGLESMSGERARQRNQFDTEIRLSTKLRTGNLPQLTVTASNTNGCNVENPVP